MQKISQILCVIDPTTDKQPALERAAWLAKKAGAELELLVCYYNEYLSGDRLFDSPSLEKAREEVIAGHVKHLESMAEPLRADGIVVRTKAVWDHPLYEGIVRRATESGADIVFKDTHHHSALTRALFTNTDWNLIRTCPAGQGFLMTSLPPDDALHSAALALAPVLRKPFTAAQLSAFLSAGGPS